MIETFRAFTCILCRRPRRKADGRPVQDSPNNSWRCANSDECAAYTLAVNVLGRVFP